MTPLHKWSRCRPTDPHEIDFGHCQALSIREFAPWISDASFWLTPEIHPRSGNPFLSGKPTPTDNPEINWRRAIEAILVERPPGEPTGVLSSIRSEADSPTQRALKNWGEPVRPTHADNADAPFSYFGNGTHRAWRAREMGLPIPVVSTLSDCCWWDPGSAMATIWNELVWWNHYTPGDFQELNRPYITLVMRGFIAVADLVRIEQKVQGL